MGARDESKNIDSTLEAIKMKFGEGTYSASSLILDLKHPDLKTKYKAFQQLDLIALSLGPEKAKFELIPYIKSKYFKVLTRYFSSSVASLVKTIK